MATVHEWDKYENFHTFCMKKAATTDIVVIQSARSVAAKPRFDLIMVSYEANHIK